MPMTSKTFVPFEMKTSRIEVWSYDNKTLVGVLHNPYFPHPQYFPSLTHFILIMDVLLDAISFPQNTVEPRTFVRDTRHVSILDEAPSVEAPAKLLSTFSIKVLFRQHASWQGSVCWLEQSLESEFRSVLELVLLIDSVLSQNIDEME